MVAGHIDHLVHRRRDNVAIESGVVIPDRGITPEEETIQREKVEVMVQVLRELSARDRDVLTRFYRYEQPQEQICREMKLTATQFRLLKSRAKPASPNWEERSSSEYFSENVLAVLTLCELNDACWS
jgi:DNA-directed RNA polymerase specialized sigma24 family protein